MSLIFRVVWPLFSITATWALLLAVIIGIGLLFQRLMRLRKVDSTRVLMAFWTGYGLVVLFLQIWHLAFPIQWPALVVVSIPGVIGFVAHARLLIGWLRGIWASRKIVVLLTVLLVLWTANQCSGPCNLFDSKVAHFNIVRWATEYPIVVGLGNLHDRLAFNHSSLLFSAMLEVGPWYRRAFHLSNGLLWIVLAFQGILGARRLFASSPRWRAVGLFEVFMLVAAFMWRYHLPTHSSTFPVSVLLLVAASALFRFLLDLEPDQATRNYDVIFICTTLAAAVCAKVTAAGFALAGCLVVMAVYVIRARRAGYSYVRTLALAAALPALMVVTLVARSVIVSGTIVYPSNLGLDVPWRIPSWRADRLGKLIQASSWTGGRREIIVGALAEGVREEGSTFKWEWVVPWLTCRRTLQQAFSPLGFIPLVLAISWVVGRRKKPEVAGSKAAWLLLVPAIVAIVFWLCTSPAPRHGGVLFWILSGTICGLLWRRQELNRKYAAVLVVVFLGCCLFLLRYPKGSKILIGPGSEFGFHPAPVLKTVPYVTRSGLTIFVPPDYTTRTTPYTFASGRTIDVPINSACGDAPLPCAPYGTPSLRLREPGDMAAGFLSGPGPE